MIKIQNTVKLGTIIMHTIHMAIIIIFRALKLTH